MKTLSTLTRQGLQKYAEQGYWTASQAPYGYARALIDPVTSNIERILEPGKRKSRDQRVKLVAGDQDKIAVVRKVFELYANNEQGIMAITTFLNKKQVPNPSGKPHWHKSTLHNILKNPVYLGSIKLHKGRTDEIETPNAHQALIEKEIFIKVQKKLEKSEFGKGGGHTTPYILTGLVECENCSNNLHGATDNTKERKGYRCAGYTCKGKDVCDSPYYSSELLEKPVIEYLQALMSSPQWSELVLKATSHAIGKDDKNLTERLSTAQAEYEQNKTKIRNLTLAIADGLPRETAIKTILELEKQQENLEELISKAETRKAEGGQYQQEANKLYLLGTEFDKRFEQLTPQEKKKLVRMFLAHATINHGAQKGITYNFYEFPNLTGEKNINTKKIYCQLLEETSDTESQQCAQETIKINRSTLSGSPLSVTERIPALDALIQQGKTLREMVKTERETFSFIEHYIRQTGQYEQWKEKRKRIPTQGKPIRLGKTEREIETEILALASEKGASATAIAKALEPKSIPYHSILSILHKNGIVLKKGPKGPTGPRGVRTRIPTRDELIRQGKTLQEIAGTEGITKEAIRQYIERSRQYEQWKQAKNAKGPERISERDELIQQGKTLREIAEKEGINYQIIYHYIKRTGQHEEWKKAKERESPEARENALEEIASALKSVFLQRAQQEGWAYEQAAKYQLSLKHRGPEEIAFERLVKLFTIYEQTKQKGERLSLEELGNTANLHASVVGYILKRTGLPHLNPGIGRLPPNKLKALERAFEVEHLSNDDIAYFVGTTWTTVDKYFMGGRNTKRGSHNLSYTKASTIYEAIDAGFTEEETAEYTGAGQAQVKRALKHRPEFEKTIIAELKIIYPDAEITKPYLTKTQK